MLLGTLGATGLSGALGASGLAQPSYGARPRVRLWLDRDTYVPGQVMTLRLRETVSRHVHVRIHDSAGTVWQKVLKNDRRHVWKAAAGTAGTAGVITLRVKRRDGRVFLRQVGYAVAGPPTPPVSRALIGMSAPPDQWDQRVAEVGAGLGARRIFADLAQGYTHQMRLVEQAHADGMLPVISYKVGSDVDGAVNGSFNAVADQAAARLASYGRPTAVTFWHEPHGDMTPTQYVAASLQLLPVFKRGELRVGPLLNGWLMDNRMADFASYCPDELFAVWDWMGIDSYESGTFASPGTTKAADRIPALLQYVRSRGFSHQLGVGEYSGYSAATVADAGSALLDTPDVWFGCLWNSATEEVDLVLTGDRLAAFQQTLAAAMAA
jgi:hypothetical protein